MEKETPMIVDIQSELEKQEAVVEDHSTPFNKALDQYISQYGLEEEENPQQRGKKQSERQSNMAKLITITGDMLGIERDRLQNLRENFDLLDDNGDGKIDTKEAQDSPVLAEKGVQGLKDHGLSGKQKADLFLKDVDKYGIGQSNDGKITASELRLNASSLVVTVEQHNKLHDITSEMKDKVIDKDNLSKLTHASYDSLPSQIIDEDSIPASKSSAVKLASQTFINGLAELAKDAKPIPPNTTPIPGNQAPER